MPGLPATRLGDKASDNSSATSASEDVFVNNLGWVRLEDTFGSPCNGEVVSSSETVFANNMGVARTNDALDCDATIVEGSENVFSG